jgi:hypothetical protein
MNEPIEFRAQLPPIQSAIKICGLDGMRIQLDIPESDMGQAVHLLTMRNKILYIKIQTEPFED